MANQFFPQLSSGALAQFPLRRTRTLRTITNVLPGGDLILFPDSGLKTTEWQLAYQGLNFAEMEALKAFFDACSGPLYPFSFLDPAGNLLAWSSDPANGAWARAQTLRIEPSVADPFGGPNAFTLTNTGQVYQTFTQALSVLCSYQYCFSFFARADESCLLKSVRSGETYSLIIDHSLTTEWLRFQSSGRLMDSGSQFSVGLSLSPGQQITLYGLQCEAQIAPSSYQQTSGKSGIYTNTFWLDEYLEITSDSPTSFSTVINLQTAG